MTGNRTVTHSHITDERFRIRTKYIQTVQVNAVFNPLQNPLIHFTLNAFPTLYVRYLQAHKVSGRISPAQSLSHFPTGCVCPVPAAPWHCWIRLWLPALPCTVLRVQLHLCEADGKPNFLRMALPAQSKPISTPYGGTLFSLGWDSCILCIDQGLNSYS